MIDRIELHCHTRMSEMAGLADVSELIRKAREIGMPAIAITDNDVVQAFPKAFGECRNTEKEGQSDSFKVLYGAEISLLDDLGDPAFGSGNATVVADDKQRKGHPLTSNETSESYRAVILAASQEGMRNLYELISEASMNSHGGRPAIPKSVFRKKREGLLIGSCAEDGEVSRALLDNTSEENPALKELVTFYDYLEIEPVENYYRPLGRYCEYELTSEDIIELIKKTVLIGSLYNRPVVASPNVFYVNEEDANAHNILKNSSGTGNDIEKSAKHHLMSAKELVQEYEFLGEADATRVVIDNPRTIVGSIGETKPFIKDTCYPVYPQADEKLNKICYDRARQLYGEELPDEIGSVLASELNGIRENGYASLYMIAHDLVEKSKSAGQFTSTRGNCGASLAAYFAGITETNPLPPHYHCGNCGFVDFKVRNLPVLDIGDAGADLPERKCPICGEALLRDGFDTPVETFHGSGFRREPDFDLNYADDYKAEAQRDLENIEGVGSVFRAGVIRSLTEKQASEYVRECLFSGNEDQGKELPSDVVEKLVGVKTGNGVHPGGMIVIPEGVDVYEYTPVLQSESGVIPSTQMNYLDLDGTLLKMDLLTYKPLGMLRIISGETGVDPAFISLNDERVMSLFSGTEALGIEPEQIAGFSTGTLGVPEFGNLRAELILKKTKPEKFSDLIRLLGLLRGPGYFISNVNELASSNDGERIRLSDCITNQDDVMLYLIDKGVERDVAFRVMEHVRRGRARNGFPGEFENAMRKCGVPKPFLDECRRVRYLYPKAHCANYALIVWRLLHYKLYYPEAFYRAWLTCGAEAVDKAFVDKGLDYAVKTYSELKGGDAEHLDSQRRAMLREIPVVMEMLARNVRI